MMSYNKLILTLLGLLVLAAWLVVAFADVIDGVSA